MSSDTKAPHQEMEALIDEFANAHYRLGYAWGAGNLGKFDAEKAATKVTKEFRAALRAALTAPAVEQQQQEPEDWPYGRNGQRWEEDADTPAVEQQEREPETIPSGEEWYEWTQELIARGRVVRDQFRRVSPALALIDVRRPLAGYGNARELGFDGKKEGGELHQALCDVYATFAAALRSQPSSQQGWRTISEAPKDGTDIIALLTGSNVFVAYFGSGAWRYRQTAFAIHGPIRGWIPAPPSLTEAP